MAENRSDDPFAGLSLGEQAAIARVEQALFGTAAAPALISRYEIIEAIGSGAFGRVYKARDPNLDRVIAIKLLADPSGGAGQARLIREAKIMATVGHPNVAAVYDAGVAGTGADARVFVAMELVEGQSLREWLAQPRSTAEALAVVRQAGYGLAAAHEAGVVHGDFKPENVLVGADGRVRVVDFGLARATEDFREPASDSAAPASAPAPDSGSGSGSDAGAGAGGGKTVTGALVGTPAYMAPEQHEGRPANALSDQFAFWIVLWEALAGERPFGGSTAAEVAAAAREGRRRELPPGRRASRWLQRAVARGLSANPAARFSTMSEALAALARRPRWGMRAAIAAAIGAAATAGMMFAFPYDVSTPCASAAAALGPVWSEARRAQIERAFSSSEVPYGAQAWNGAERVFSAYAEQWSLARLDACEAAFVRKEQSDGMLDRRTACLRERLGALDAALELLEKADSAAVMRAVAVAEALPAIAPCSDLAALGASVPLPSDPEVRQTVERLSDELSRARSLYTLGRDSEALELAQRIDLEAGPVGYAPLRATARMWVAEALMGQGRDNEALAAGREAFDLALEAQDQRMAVIAATILAFGGARDTRQKDEALRWVATGRSLLAHVRDPEVEGKLANAEGNILLTAGEGERARPAFEKTIELFAAIDPDHSNIGSSLAMLGIIDLEAGDVELASKELSEALSRIERTLGDAHPEVASALVNLSLTDSAKGEYETAEKRVRRALDIQHKAYGAAHPYIGYARLELGNVLVRLGRLDDAEPELEQAARLFSSSFGPGHPMTAQVALAQADLAARRGRAEHAIDLAEAALSTLERAGGRQGAQVALAEATLAFALRSAGRAADALTHADAAIELAKDLDEASPQRALLLYQRGEAQLAMKKAADALESLRAAERVLATRPVDPRLLEQIRDAIDRAE